MLSDALSQSPRSWSYFQVLISLGYRIWKLSQSCRIKRGADSFYPSVQFLDISYVFSLEMAQYGELIFLSIKDYHKHLLSKHKIFFLNLYFPLYAISKNHLLHLHSYSSWKDWCKTDWQHYKAHRVWNRFLYKLNEMEKWHIIESFLILHAGILLIGSSDHFHIASTTGKKREKKLHNFSVVLLLYFYTTVRFTFYKAI